MHIDKFKDKEGFGYTFTDGCYYEDAESLIATGLLGFCGCGMPDAALEHVRKALQIVYDLKHLVWEKKITYKQWEERKKEIFSNSGQEYFMWYFLDNKELTEHGGNIASKANNYRSNQQRTNLTWLLCYITCYVSGTVKQNESSFNERQ